MNEMPKPLHAALGACADLLYSHQLRLSEANKVVAEIEREMIDLRAHIMTLLKAENATGVSGKLACVKLVKKQTPSVENWSLLYAHIAKTGEWGLLQKRVGTTAIKEHWEAGIELPGVTKLEVVTISLTKA